jgi:uncharacterized protein (TIGR03000 family)
MFNPSIYLAGAILGFTTAFFATAQSSYAQTKASEGVVLHEMNSATIGSSYPGFGVGWGLWPGWGPGCGWWGGCGCGVGAGSAWNAYSGWGMGWGYPYWCGGGGYCYPYFWGPDYYCYKAYYWPLAGLNYLQGGGGAGISPVGFQDNSSIKIIRDESAKVQVLVPDNAEVWFDGNKTTQTGPVRKLTTEALAAGKTIRHEVKVAWTVDGQPTTQTIDVEVQAGSQRILNFMAGAPEAKK